MITRNKLVSVVVAAGWGLVSLLPWWQLRIAFSDQSGTGTWVFTADVWRSSTPAALAVIVAAVVSVVLVATRGHAAGAAAARHGPGHRVYTGCPAGLDCLVNRPADRSATRVRMTVTMGDAAAVDDMVLPDFHVLHDRLEIRPGPGYAEGPASMPRSLR